MASNRYLNRNSWMLTAAVAFAASAACVASSASQAAAAQGPVNVAVNSTEATPESSMRSAPLGFPPLQAGVRKAAMEGSVALRRYIWRTRMIYNYYFPTFAKSE